MFARALRALVAEENRALFAVKVAGYPEEFFPFLRVGVLDSERNTLQFGMRFRHRLEHDMNLSCPQGVGPSHLRRLPASAGTVDFPLFRCNS